MKAKLKALSLLFVFLTPCAAFAQDSTPPASAAPAAPAPLWQADLGRGYTLSLPSWSQLESVNTVALRDYYNGQWLVGYGHEFLYLNRNGSELAYADVWNAFNTDDGRGVFGGSLGVHPAAATFEGIASLAGSAATFKGSVPPWAQKANQFSSIEVGAGDRLFGGGGPGVKRFAAIVGAEVRIPFGDLFGKSGSL